MKKFRQNFKGFTLLETILVVVILAAALGFGLLYYQTTQVRSDLNTQGNILVSYLRLAQSNANSGNSLQATALHLQQNFYSTFFAPTYDENATTNFKVELPPTIQITNINLNGGGNDIVFLKPNGETDNFGTFDLASNQINKSITIKISQIGTINY